MNILKLFQPVLDHVLDDFYDYETTETLKFILRETITGSTYYNKILKEKELKRTSDWIFKVNRRRYSNSELVNLDMLDLGYSYIETLPKGIFNHLSNLTSLDLRWNKIKTLPEKIFNKLVNLQELNLNNNKIESLPKGIFGNLVSLVNLRLFNNKIEVLPERIFDNLVNLQVLYLTWNKIEKIPTVNSNCRMYI